MFRCGAYVKVMPLECRPPHSQRYRCPEQSLPKLLTDLGSDGVSTISTRHQRFTFVHLLYIHVTAFSCLFRLDLVPEKLNTKKSNSYPLTCHSHLEIGWG
jgi:hypothetical protein